MDGEPSRPGLAQRASFVCASVQDAAGALVHRTFDIVYVSFGALCWLPSLEQWAAQVAALARPGGRLHLHDSHPFSWSLADEAPVLTHTYFEEPEPFVDDSEQTSPTRTDRWPIRAPTSGTTASARWSPPSSAAACASTS